jgi:outer membrane autotransporter protein
MDIENQPDDWAVFVSGNGQYVDLPGNSTVLGYHFHNSGATVGIDRMIRTNLAFGFTADYAGTLASLPNDGEAKVDGGRGGIYGTWFEDDNYVMGSFGGGYNHYRTSRTSVGGTANGTTDGYEFDGMVGGGHDFRKGDLLFGPTLNAQYTYVQVDAFTETGSLAPLQLENNSSESFLTRLGAHVGYNWKLPQVTLRPDLQLAWQHEYLDQDRAISSRFANGVGNIFQVNSPEIGRDSLALDAVVNMQWTHTFSTFLAYHGDLAREDYVEHSISGGVGISF